MKNPLRVTIIHKVNGKETTRAATEQERNGTTLFNWDFELPKGYEIKFSIKDQNFKFLFESYNNITNTVYLREV